VVLAAILPGTHLPYSKRQRYTYQLESFESGQVVSISLGARTLRGVAVEEVKKDSTSALKIKKARAEAWRLPMHNVLLAKDIAEHYRAAESLVIKTMLPPQGAMPSIKREASRLVFSQVPTLNDEQQAAANSVIAALGTSAAFLLEGITGSGKTEVYSTIAKKVLAQGKQVVLLVPEISMTPQQAKRLEHYFGASVMTWHSGLTPKERRDRWAALASGQPALVLGPRSALFLPLPRLALIVLDEEHDASFKQWDQEPRYHARAVARMLSMRAQCPVVYGSATPSLELLQQARQKSITHLKLTKRYGDSQLPRISLIDVRGMPTNVIFSPATVEALQETIDQKKQSIVLINRRGSSVVLLCRDCGNIWRCQKCDRSLVTHLDPRPKLACHYCAQDYPLPTICTKCKGTRLLTRGRGTQKVEQELRRIFPKASIARLDRDISRSKKKVTALAHSVTSGDVDILVGTQLVAKGWDIEKLQTVIVLDTDQGIFQPHFRSHERTVQLLWQVAGRAGRRQDPGNVYIETCFPEHATYQAVQHRSLAAFYDQELAERKKFNLPPYSRILKVIVADDSADERVRKMKVVLASIHKVLAGDTALARVTTVLPEQPHINSRGKTELHVSLTTPDPRVFFSALPNDSIVDVDPEEL
jgi:primosomal protein N' (replication factor Y)